MTAYFDDFEPPASLGRRSVRGGALAISARAVSGLIQLGSVLVLARLLTPEDYGLVAMVTAVTGFAPLLVDLGTRDAISQRLRISAGEVSAPPDTRSTRNNSNSVGPSQSAGRISVLVKKGEHDIRVAIAERHVDDPAKSKAEENPTLNPRHSTPLARCGIFLGGSEGPSFSLVKLGPSLSAILGVPPNYRSAGRRFPFSP